MDKHTQPRTQKFKSRASLTPGRVNLSYKERVAKRDKTKGISPEQFSNSDYYVALNY